MSSWEELRQSESLVKEFEGYNELTHVVIRFKWVRFFDAEYRDQCKRDVEIFFNNLCSRLIKNYSRGKRVKCLCFWEMGDSNGYHCHCVVGWSFNRYCCTGLGGLSVDKAFNRKKMDALKMCKTIYSAWVDLGYADQGLLEYCMKEFRDSDSMYSDMTRVEIWRGGRMPASLDCDTWRGW